MYCNFPVEYLTTCRYVSPAQFVGVIIGVAYGQVLATVLLPCRLAIKSSSMVQYPGTCHVLCSPTPTITTKRANLV